MKFIIATNNKKKLVEMERILKPLGIEAVSAKDAGVVLDEVDETGTTFLENAFLKANAAYVKTGMPAVADDSGICVDALGGRPGIFSARYSPEDCVTDEDRTAKILEELKGVPDENRGAHYTCAICCILPDGSKIEIEETCEGKIGYEFIGDGGFGYDPIFYFGDKTFAQISGEEKDKVSHRGKALRKLQAALKEHFG
ncbi:RdgB/HAM1 family non-canonical purine NTP pyrophosphatase [Lachnoclostridium sp. MSJ-17]|uniref:RdgB/HAM1 family non-canonical purine NTP pyrophosphatase n=1 Tax=Lachnoclostridium sp. MSJ-17 TaxID=2841516 RepID=UPI001C110BB3|nr:RdgB/HAM1 family non-canonical purine NTP pyrophosphatase [Lachnoclostridium sp. MSJ-17]MBU5461901.1 RdgB/HAM1 family non-canonical purine NTP pyrophosphatase [Lachnoclostridium sp. MSJ-17]